LRDAALHARARAFPLGLGVLISKGVAAWQRVLAHLTPAGAKASRPGQAPPPGRTATSLPAALTTELINILAAIALAGTSPGHPPAPPPPRSAVLA
jgi:hypothetical protein